MVKKKRNYRREILEILEKHDGVKGFNKLREIGNFHRTSLQKNLKELEKTGEIVIRNYHSNKTIYSLPTFAFYSILKILFPKIFQLKEKLHHSTEKSRKQFLKKLSKELLSSCYSIDLLLLGFWEFDIGGDRLDMVEKIKKWLENELALSFLSLSQKEQKEILFQQTPKNHGEELLKTCRKIWKKYDI